MKFLNFKNYIYGATMVFFTFALFACHNTPSNEELQRSINDSLKTNSGMNNVTATVADGKVTLNGTCEGDNCVAETESRIKKIDGVKGVQNNLSMAVQSTDLTLRTQVQAIASRYAGVQADVANGSIVLRGSINRDQLQPLMSELSSLQASKIDNQLAIK
ncbi:MAG: BON domain-containing protein [Bacteroidota bacterium]|nr:BON domain-containing protein [Bacteroidota bacterium]